MIVDPLKDAYTQGDVEKMIEKRDAQRPMEHMGDAFDVAHAALEPHTFRGTTARGTGIRYGLRSVTRPRNRR